MSEASFTFYRETNFKTVELNGKKVEIPEEWEVIELGNPKYFEVIMGQSPPSSSYNQEGRGMPFIQGAAEFGHIYVIPKLFTTKPLKIAKKGDILISVRAPVGEVNIAPFDLCIGRGVGAIRPNPKKVDVFFLYYRMSIAKEELERFGCGAVFKAITKNTLKLFKIPLPPLPEQKKIAEVLRSIDEAIQAVEESIEKLERLKKGTMEQLLTKGIGHTKFKTVELNGRKVRIPEEWEVVELGEVADINKESVDPRRAFPDKEFVYIDIDSVENGTGKIKTPKRLYGKDAPSRARRVVHANDVIMSTVRPYLKAFALVPEEYDGQVCSTGFAVLTPKPQILDSWYLLYALFSDNTIFQCKSMMVGGQYPALTNAQVAQIKIPLPPLEEQKKIAEILRTIDEAIEAKRQKKEKLERMKKAVMEKLLTGRVRIR